MALPALTADGMPGSPGGSDEAVKRELERAAGGDSPTAPLFLLGQVGLMRLAVWRPLSTLSSHSGWQASDLASPLLLPCLTPEPHGYPR